MKYLVTGGAGYFGSALINRLLINKRNKVISYDLNKSHIKNHNFISVLGDIRDQKKLSKYLNSVDVVFHNVAQVPIAKDKDLFWSVNRDGTKKLLESCLQNKVKKLIYTSSSAVFGIPKKNPVTNSTIPIPSEDYGKAKLAGERLCFEYKKKGLNCSIIRPRTILGTGRLGIFQILFEWVYQGKNIPVIDNGENIYQFIHADDLAEASIKLSKLDKDYVINVGAESFGSMRETLEALISHAKTKSKIRSLPLYFTEKAMNLSSSLGLSPLGPYHALMYGRSLYFETNQTFKILGFKPHYDNKSMIIESYDWYVKNRNTILNLGSKNASLHQSPLKQRILKLIPYFLL